MMDGKRKREWKKKNSEDGKSSVSWKSVGFFLLLFVIGQNNILNH